MDQIHAKYEKNGLKSYIVLLQDNLGNPPTKAFCTQWVAINKPHMKVLIDPLLKTGIYGGKETSIITNEEGFIVYKTHGDYATTIEGKIVEELEKK